MKSKEPIDQIRQSLRNLARVYSHEMARLESALSILSQELEFKEAMLWDEPLTSAGGGPTPCDLPVADRSLLAIRWRGRMCFLGNTISFRLFERLARRPNQYVSYAQLLNDAWEGSRSSDAIRSAVKVLRKKLAENDMEELASMIDGSMIEHYGLTLHQRSYCRNLCSGS